MQPLSLVKENYRKFINGNWVQRSAVIYVDASAAGNTNGDDWGSATYYSKFDQGIRCLNPARNCTNAPYDYLEQTINTAFEAYDTVNMIPVTVTVADVEDYYDELYKGYQKVGNVDFSKNCHGYSFGVGNWPADDAYGSYTLVEDGTHPCYIPARDMEHATIALNGAHSMKVTGGKCTGTEYTWMIFTSSSEKFRASAKYEQSDGCDDGVDITKATKSSFGLYEPF